MTSAQGRDYSAYQARLTASTLAGLDFAFAKATNGTSEVDPNLASNWKVLGSWGKPRGSYHEYVPGSSPTAQAEYFINALKAAGGLKAGDMLAVVASDYTGITDADILAWCNEVRALAGPKFPILAYSDLSVAQGLVSTSEKYDLWVAWPSSTAPKAPQWAPAKWSAWRLWQWNETGIDQDAYNGTPAELNAWIATYTGKENPVEITKTPPGNWEGPVVLIGKGTDGNLYETKTSDGKTWTTPVKQ